MPFEGLSLKDKALELPPGPLRGHVADSGKACSFQGTYGNFQFGSFVFVELQGLGPSVKLVEAPQKASQKAFWKAFWKATKSLTDETILAKILRLKEMRNSHMTSLVF